MHYKIYRFLEPEQATDRSRFPGSIVFPEMLSDELPKDSVILDGERISTTYYAEFDANTGIYSDPIIKLEYNFNRDETGYAVSRDRVISWAYEDDTWSPVTKTHTHYYSSLYDKQNELTSRRRNIVLENKSLAEGLGLREAIKELYLKYQIEITQYAEAGSALFSEKLATDTELVWLNAMTPDNVMTLRQFLISKFTIGLL